MLVLLTIIIPQTVEVRVTGLGVCQPVMTYETETIELREYVKGVLPNEWLPGWDDEALRAGAIAVKNYAVSTYNSKGYLWDCNYHQVYNPDKRTEATDQAVDDTWDWWLWNDGIVRTYYDDYPAACYSRGHECMSQYFTQADAVIGQGWQAIVMKSYEGNLIDLPSDRVRMIRRYR